MRSSAVVNEVRVRHVELEADSARAVCRERLRRTPARARRPRAHRGHATAALTCGGPRARLRCPRAHRDHATATAEHIKCVARTTSRGAGGSEKSEAQSVHRMLEESSRRMARPSETPARDPVISAGTERGDSGGVNMVAVLRSVVTITVTTRVDDLKSLGSAQREGSGPRYLQRVLTSG
jgi:hypothetical protein